MYVKWGVCLIFVVILLSHHTLDCCVLVQWSRGYASLWMACWWVEWIGVPHSLACALPMLHVSLRCTIRVIWLSHLQLDGCGLRGHLTILRKLWQVLFDSILTNTATVDFDVCRGGFIETNFWNTAWQSRICHWVQCHKRLGVVNLGLRMYLSGCLECSKGFESRFYGRQVFTLRVERSDNRINLNLSKVRTMQVWASKSPCSYV